MATFSPSPAPRRTNRRPLGGSPPVTSRRTKLATSRPTSRLATPIRPECLSVASHGEHASPASGMDVDEGNSVTIERALRSEMVFAMSEELKVTCHAHLPVEVKQALKNADFYNDAYTGEIDTATGFSLVASEQSCFVWQHAQAVKATPTCYIFSCPRDFKQSGPPLHALVPYGHSREPGLILVSPSGEVRFWYGIGIGLAGGDNFSTTSLSLSSGEYVTNLVRSDPQTYIVSSSAGHFFRMILTSSGGKYRLNSHIFSRPQSSLSLSRLLPSIWSSPYSSMTAESGNVNALACGIETTAGREIWALVDTRLQKWNMAVEGWEEIVLDEELLGIIRSAIRDAFPSASSDNSKLDLELLDLIVASPGVLVILVSYAGIEEEAAMDVGGIRRIYALVWLSCRDSLMVEFVSGVPYQNTSTSGAPMHPRMQSISGGAIVSIQFGDAVALCARNSDYRDRLELKSATDRTLGVGVTESENALLVLTSGTMIKVQMDTERISSFDPDTGQTNLVKSIMTQAILYGSNVENPLQFSFPPEVDEEALMQAAEQLSRAILESDTMVVRRNHDLGAQLTERKERLSWLIQFINDNAVLNKMSQRSRQRLATDAETLYACHQLWLFHNDTLVTGHGHSVLSEAVYMFMRSIGEGHHEDIMRTFFRTRASDIGRLFPYVTEIVERSTHERDRSLSNVLPEANMVILTVLKSAFGYGGYNLGVYGVELPMINPWTSQPVVIDIVMRLFEMTTRLIEGPTSRSDLGGNSKKEANEQLPELASILFACIQERLGWLGSAIAADQEGTQQDKTELETRFAILRPEVLETLFNNGHKGPAFMLAEQYRDFASLASLCHKETVYPLEQNPHAERIEQYIERYRSEFTTALFSWYIDHGELRLLFAHSDTHDAYMDIFFAENHFPSVSWVHDLGKARYSPASRVLLGESGKASNLETKHLMLSIGKLAHLAQLHEDEASADESVLDAFHDDLDFVSVHQSLVERFRSVLATARGRLSLDAQVEAIVKAEATLLSDKKAHLTTFKHCVRRLLQGKALSPEDIIDILTLKDNKDNTDDYATALHILARVRNMPEARRMSACQAVWRRTYLHDDWDSIRRTANVTDMELNERFQRTALYSSLKAIIPKQPQRTGCDLTPAQALPTPSSTEISARWPTMDGEGIAAILINYQKESDQLAQLGLDDVYHRVRELVMQDVMWES